MAKCDLKVPPKYPEIGDEWYREDGVCFMWTDRGWEKK